MGDPRVLFFRKRWIVNDGVKKRKWKVGKNHNTEFHLTDHSLFVLHPNDEKPIIRNIGEPLSQFQHGNVQVKKGELSIRFIFRHATQTLIYDNIKYTIILPKCYHAEHKCTLSKFDATYNNLNMVMVRL